MAEKKTTTIEETAEAVTYIANSLETEFGSVANRARLGIGNCNRILKSRKATAEQKAAAYAMKQRLVDVQKLGNAEWSAIASA